MAPKRLTAHVDAFVDGSEHRIDLGRVNGRVFVNNVAMGAYGAVVQSPQYRDAKIGKAIERAQQGKIMFQRLAKAKPGIDDDAMTINASIQQSLNPLL